MQKFYLPPGTISIFIFFIYLMFTIKSIKIDQNDLFN